METILKDVNKSGLDRDVDSQCFRVVDIETLWQKICDTPPFPLQQYNTVWLYIGQKYVARNRSTQQVYKDAKTLYGELKKEKKCEAGLCAVCPRSDADVIGLNDFYK